ncbi:SMP-30/gluconolactonase/LRE family protein [Castellaniella sp. S9]|uniref:SMP-30/gluconolactonase/LRE family protein n=1 Tax=Castellaniella sp. S9 TaxID=2993652 RepID=UPI0022B41DF9|nr:SMP-30/gluconolactonase/LRE family protein [Castellaniella sp. S9]
MYAAPPVIQTTVFARIPDSLRIRGRSNRWVDVQRGGAATECFLEGPSFDREGYLYVVDVAWGRILRISPDGADVEVVVQYDGEPNGLKIHRDGRVFVADYRHGIMVLDPATRRIEPFLERSILDRFKGINDLVFASNGDLYFTDQGMTGLHDPSGCLYRYTAAGRLDRLLDNIPSPNGLVLSLDEKAVFVNATRGNCVWRVPLSPLTGMPYKVGNFIQLSGALGGPDGLAIDSAGNLAVAHIGLGVVWLFSRLGEPLARINSCEGLSITNLAYGGPENKTLYITESDSGSILKAELEVPGQPMYSHS